MDKAGKIVSCNAMHGLGERAQHAYSLFLLDFLEEECIPALLQAALGYTRRRRHVAI